MLGQRRLAWIFGSSRSGSTWLLRMLADTGDVAPIDDPHLGHHLGVWRPIPLAWGAADSEPKLSTLTEVKRDKPDFFFSERYRDAWAPALRDLIAARFEAQVRDLEREQGLENPAVVVKEPGSQSAPLLLDLFPGSKLVFLLRDGRDVVDSWLDAYKEGSWAQDEGAFSVRPERRIDLVRWLASNWLYRTEVVEKAYAAHPEADRVLVRYETLLASPAEELRRIATVLELDVGAADLKRIAELERFERVPGASRGDGCAVRAANPGGWRENLTEAEQQALSQLLDPKLGELGYNASRSQAALATA
jgi:hypothetical protein